MLHIRALHIADDKPYVLEDRWINANVVPEALGEPFQENSANEWRLKNTPYTNGEIAFHAAAQPLNESVILNCTEHSALFVIDRLTWDNTLSVTKVRLVFGPEHQLRTNP